MRKKFKKALTFCYSKSKDCVEIIFQSPASNQLRIQKEQQKRFNSYIQLKRYQQRLRKLALRVFLAVIFLFIGILIGPAVFNPEKKVEIFIPSGRGDILISNVSRSQASVIFKTLDAANQNKPLATAAVVEFFADKELKTFIGKSEIQDYAVTHIVPLEGLAEGKIYYLKIKASESKNMENAKEVNFWGGQEPIMVYATGDLIPSCAVNVPAKNNPRTEDQVAITSSSDEEGLFLSRVDREDGKDSNLISILGVQNESYLHGKEKVQTIISWETNQPGTSVLEIREEKEDREKEMEISGEMVKRHAAVLTTLKPGTVYYFKVKSVDENGAEAVSNEYSLRTPHPKDTIFETVGNNFKSLIKQIGL